MLKILLVLSFFCRISDLHLHDFVRVILVCWLSFCRCSEWSLKDGHVVSLFIQVGAVPSVSHNAWWTVLRGQGGRCHWSRAVIGCTQLPENSAGMFTQLAAAYCLFPQMNALWTHSLQLNRPICSKASHVMAFVPLMFSDNDSLLLVANANCAGVTLALPVFSITKKDTQYPVPDSIGL